jgi:hypothetical protein
MGLVRACRPIVPDATAGVAISKPFKAQWKIYVPPPTSDKYNVNKDCISVTSKKK